MARVFGFLAAFLFLPLFFGAAFGLYVSVDSLSSSSPPFVEYTGTPSILLVSPGATECRIGLDNVDFGSLPPGDCVSGGASEFGCVLPVLAQVGAGLNELPAGAYTYFVACSDGIESSAAIPVSFVVSSEKLPRIALASSVSRSVVPLGEDSVLTVSAMRFDSEPSFQSRIEVVYPDGFSETGSSLNGQIPLDGKSGSQSFSVPNIQGSYKILVSVVSVADGALLAYAPVSVTVVDSTPKIVDDNSPFSLFFVLLFAVFVCFKSFSARK